MHMFRSATLKLTAWYLLIVMAISLTFSVVVYKVGTGELARGLHHQTQMIYEDFPVFNGSPYLRPGPDLQQSEHRLLGKLIFFNIIVFAGAGLASYYLARRTLQPIEESHARQRRFTADASHELRTPLTAIRMESEVALLDTAASKKVLREALQSNIEEADKLDALINNLLRLSRLEDEQVRTGFKILQASQLAEEAVEKVKKTADMKGVSVGTEIKEADILGDKDSLVQLLTILLDNAIKYSHDHSEVTVQAYPEHDKTVLEVRDQGVGIEREALAHVFDRFYRADSSRNKAGAEGYGLGLSIAKMIADIHDGTITLSSRLGHGTTATIILPRPKAN